MGLLKIKGPVNIFIRILRRWRSRWATRRPGRTTKWATRRTSWASKRIKWANRRTGWEWGWRLGRQINKRAKWANRWFRRPRGRWSTKRERGTKWKR